MASFKVSIRKNILEEAVEIVEANSSRKAKEPAHTDEELYTEDGYPSPKLITEAYKVWHEQFGNIEIVKVGSSITDLMKSTQYKQSKT